MMMRFFFATFACFFLYVSAHGRFGLEVCMKETSQNELTGLCAKLGPPRAPPLVTYHFPCTNRHFMGIHGIYHLISLVP